MGIVVNILPYIDGCTGHAVLPLTVRAFAEPAGTEDIILRVIKTDAGKGLITCCTVLVLEGGPATAVDLPAGVRQIAGIGELHYGIIAFFPGFGTGDISRTFYQYRSVVKGQYIIIGGIPGCHKIARFFIQHYRYFPTTNPIYGIGFGDKSGIILYGHKILQLCHLRFYFRGPFVDFTARRIFGYDHEGIVVFIICRKR